MLICMRDICESMNKKGFGKWPMSTIFSLHLRRRLAPYDHVECEASACVALVAILLDRESAIRRVKKVYSSRSRAVSPPCQRHALPLALDGTFWHYT